MKKPMTKETSKLRNEETKNKENNEQTKNLKNKEIEKQAGAELC